MSTAELIIDPRFIVGSINRRLFGSFIEHIGRAVYNGIYEPGHETADSEGFRQDVIDLVNELGLSGIRYPGGNFVSGFLWEDSIGPKEDRPTRRDLAWHSTETNVVGLHEFHSWVEKVGTELMLVLNLGTRGTLEALQLLEYANTPAGSALADQRIANGAPTPLKIRTWYLGNEMDGSWQLGHRSADEYGRLAAQTAKAMRQLDPSVELVACGSSNIRMSTFGEWERAVLMHCYEDVDYISCHAYYQENDGDLGSFLASGVSMDHHIEAVIATADHVKAVKRSDKTMALSFDEWNVWYTAEWIKVEGLYRSEDIAGASWPIAPRVAEDIYTVADAVVVGSLLISLLKHANRVTSACLSMLVNAIAPIRTEPGAGAWRQTTFYPFALTSRLAKGVTLAVRTRCDDYATKEYGTVPVLDAVATHDAEGQRTSVFLVNRSQSEGVEVTIEFGALGEISVVDCQTLSDTDPYATNSAVHPERVGLKPNSSWVVERGKVTLNVPQVSWTALTLAHH